MLKSALGRGIAAALLSLAAIAAHAQAWPNKPVRVINPFPAGGGVDTFARPIAAKLSQALGQSFYVENMGGAGGTVGAAAAARRGAVRAPSSRGRSQTLHEGRPECRTRQRRCSKLFVQDARSQPRGHTTVTNPGCERGNLPGKRATARMQMHDLQ